MSLISASVFAQQEGGKDNVLFEDTDSLGEVSTIGSLDVDNISESDWKFTINTSFESLYVLRGRQAGYKVVQGVGAVSYGGASFTVWGNQPLEPSLNAVDVPEVDFTLNYSHQVTEHVNVSIGGLLQYYPDQRSSPGAIWGVAFSVDLDDVPTDPTFLYQYIFATERSEFYLLLHEDIPLTFLFDDPNLLLSLGANVGYAFQGETDYSSENGWAWAMGQVAISYLFFDEQMRIDVGPNFAVNNDGAANNIAGRESNVWLGVQAQYSF